MNSFSNYGRYFTYKDEVSRTISWGHWFTYLNIFLTILLGSAYILYTPNVEYTSLGNFYLVISWLGHFSCLVFILYMLLLFPFSFIGSLRFYRIFAVFLSVILLVFMLVDIKIYQQIRIHLSFSVIELFFEQEGFSTGINFNFLYIAIPMLILIELYFSHLSWKHIYIHNYKKTTNSFVALFLLSFVATHLLNIWASAYQYQPITQQKTLFPAYYPMTANTFLAEHGWITTEQENGLEIHKFRPVHYPLDSIRFEPIENYKNVLIILVNGLTYNNVAFGSKDSSMPELNSYAAENMLFTNHYLGVTSHREASFELIYGLPAQYLSSIEVSRYAPIILTEMRLQDYKIRAYLSDPERTILKNQNSQVAGLRNNASSIFKSDADAVSAAVRAINSWSERPQLALVSLNELYDGEQCNTTEQGDNKPVTQSKFAQCLHKEDQYIMTLKNALANAHVDDRTIVIITSAKARYNSTYERSNFHAPLIVHWPGIKSPGQNNMLTGTQDIAPTIAKEVLGIVNDTESYSTGINLRELTPRSWIISGSESEFHIISDTQTTIYDRQGNARIYSDTPGYSIQPNITTLIRAMKILNKFVEE